MGIGLLSADVLLPILEILQGDRRTVYNCALVNHAFNVPASKILYSRVTVSPPARLGVDLRDEGLSHLEQLTSACLPRYAQHVLVLQVTGFLCTRPPPRNKLGTRLIEAIDLLPNLHEILINPLSHNGDMFVDVLRCLPAVPHLRRLSVNEACTHERAIPPLVKIESLESLAIANPSRAILDLLPEWLSRLSQSLTQLHLEGNCGSITPAVLRSFIAHIPRVQALTLGLSYSLTDENVFSSLADLPALTSLKMRCYMQLKTPAPVLHLPHLTALTIQYAPIFTRAEARHFVAWVKRAVSSARRLRILRLQSDAAPSERGAHVSFDSLVIHLAHRHGSTLRVLDLGVAYIGFDAVCALAALGGCLEELTVGLRTECLVRLIAVSAAD
ncbi:hypothetical protein FIBSPDRAFT_873224 [Athelia psychrophila]|uniref:F-box domain-containing protein n=1 Tax=Athelia psychrophila TaxID=1759441 RepID=A0A165YS32_9AGAM|nr:hypothetical protein FIBSPDRAFT_873224 [Fibularhizoctonia sp. CBS 109695]